MAWEALFTAEAARDGARQNLNNLLTIRDNPLQANALVNAARARFEISEANVAVARSQLETLQAGATEQEIGMGEA
ncbi:MAG: hypothetical protein GTO63_08310, partial [Anaerolineae bacterium]|nr:hypothetical protein [Anaerolineae bacterium]NIN94910.1 hypothetical protein [Anaerolineae bacterium]